MSPSPPPRPRGVRRPEKVNPDRVTKRQVPVLIRTTWYRAEEALEAKYQERLDAFKVSIQADYNVRIAFTPGYHIAILTFD